MTIEPEIRGTELAELLHPMSTETFAAEYAGRRPLLIRGDQAKLERLLPGGFGPRDFFAAVRASAALKLASHGLWAGKHDALISESHHTLKLPPIGPDEMEAKLAAGVTLLSETLADRRLVTLAIALKSQLEHPGELQTGATVGRKGNVFRAHCDSSSNLFIQASGRKRFSITSGPILPAPRDTITVFADGTAAYQTLELAEWEQIEPVRIDELQQIELGPGDALYIPAGTVHATEALDDDCVTIILGFIHPNVLSVVAKVLEERLESQLVWRHLPLLRTAPDAPGRLPREAERFLEDRLAELRDLAHAITGDAFDLRRHMQQLIADPGEDMLACLDLAIAEDASDPVEARERLRVSRKLPICLAAGTTPDGAPIVSLHRGKLEVAASHEYSAILRHLVRHESFTAADACHFHDGGGEHPWDDVRGYLEALLQQGYLERERA